MADLQDLLNELNPGTLNSYTLERFAIKKDQYNLGTFSELREAIGEIYSGALDKSPVGPYRGICLAVTQDKIGDIPGVKTPKLKIGGKDAGTGYLLSVIVRVEELHAAIPKPVLRGLQKLSCVSYKNAALLLHPVFYGFTDTAGSVPKAGNIVEVNFPDPFDRSYGHYLGIVDDTVEAEETGDQGAAEIATGGAEQPLGESG